LADSSWQWAVDKEQMAVGSWQKAIGKNASLFSRAKTIAMWSFIGVAHFICISLFIFYYAIDYVVDYAK
jgi:hypothetical protein